MPGERIGKIGERVQEAHTHFIRGQMAEAALQGGDIAGVDLPQQQRAAVARVHGLALRRRCRGYA
jgi:hypothetical protein